MNEVFIVEARRTPFGSFGGALRDISAPDLASQVMRDLLHRSQIPATAIDEVIAGQVLQGGCGQAPARQAMRKAGLPDSVHAMTINKVCGSGLKAIMLAADSIRLGDATCVIAGGMESMSLAPYALPTLRTGQRMGHAQALDLMIYDALQDPYSDRHMGEITEIWVERHGLSREDQDLYAARSYRLAQAAVAAGTFTDELTPVIKSSRKGDVTVDQDEEPGRGNIDKLSSLRPAFNKEGTITAGNASTINDGAAFVLTCSKQAMERHNLKPIARLVASATNSIAPNDFAEAPIGAIQKAIARAGLTLADIDLFEINEAFAAVPLIAIRELGIDPDKVNVNGGAVAIGHPVGASGARLAVTLIRELQARQLRYGTASLCIGGGEAVAAIFERC
ncbi:thiolase family protein [Deltaproteobacteria bacterium IMCC39524]|nr:thiolase family protein [Deltaproteobacteria bacterium IMCC39524]